MGRWYGAGALIGLAACNGGDGDTDGTLDEPIEAYACLHVAEGDIVDSAPTREAANTIEVGRNPYRINLVSGEVGYVAFDAGGPMELTVLTDFVDAVPAWWDGETRVALDPGEPDDTCDTDIPEVKKLSVSGGPAWLELGPIFQGNVWLMLGE